MSDSATGGKSDLPSQPHAAQPSDHTTAADAEWQEVEQALSHAANPVQSSDQLSDGVVPLAVHPSASVRSFDPATPLVMVETAFLASAASLIWLVNFYFPLGPVLRIFFPIPIALIYLRWGARPAWMGALVAGLLLSVLMGPPRSLLYIMPFGVMGVLLGLLWRRRASWAMAIAQAGILGAIGFFFRVWLFSLLLGEDLWLYSTIQVTNLIDWICLQLGILFQPSLGFIQASVTLLIVINNLIYVFVVHLVALFLFDRLHTPIPRPPKWVQVLMEYEE